MRGDVELERETEAHDDDVACQRIEIEFAIPVFIPPGALRELDWLLSGIVRMKMNQLKGYVHWVSGHGSKPLWSQADATCLGKTPASDAPASGEPRFDDSVYHIETSCIERPDKTTGLTHVDDIPKVKRSPHDPEGM